MIKWSHYYFFYVNGNASIILYVLRLFFKLSFDFMSANGWYMLSGRISESVPVRRTRNCDARIQRTTHHCTRNAIYNS